MSSSFAKQKKRLRRKRAMTDEQAGSIVRALNRNASVKRQEIQNMRPQIAREAWKKLKEEWTPEVQGELLLYVMAYLHCERGFGRERLRRFLHEFNEFADTMRRDGTHAPQVVDLLKEECGLDVLKEFRICDNESERVERRLRA